MSNLTNLLAFAASGLAFTRFAELMALPWLAAIAAEYLIFRRFFAADLNPAAVAGPAAVPAPAHNGAGGRAFTAIWDLRPMGCRAAGRASR